MYKRILSASVSGIPLTAFQFHPRINILSGADAEDIVLTLAGIWGGMSPLNGKTKIQWRAAGSLFVHIIDGACRVEKTSTQGKSTAQLVKEFHKYRFLNLRNCRNILNDAHLPAVIFGANDWLLNKLKEVLDPEDDRPLFVINFLERLDEAVDLQPVFEALNATGRQVFIAVPHYYEIKELEGMPYGTTIHSL